MCGSGYNGVGGPFAVERYSKQYWGSHIFLRWGPKEEIPYKKEIEELKAKINERLKERNINDFIKFGTREENRIIW